MRKRAGIVAMLALSAAACGPGASGSNSSTPASNVSSFNPPWLSANQNAGGSPQNGGTLTLLGASDLDHLDTASGYSTVTYTLERAFARQLYSYPSSTNIDMANTIVPDVAKDKPGISSDGKTYTIHMRTDVMWNTSPPRAVTSQDFLLGFKRLCNPASPVGAPQYYTATIAGFDKYCTAFGSVAGDAPTMKAFMDGNQISGITTPDSSTIVFTLTQPASDFLNILAMPFASAAPVEYEQYVPDSADQHQHLLSDAPYTVVKYVANTEIDLDKNPAWTQASDPIRHQYVDHIQVKEGATEASVQQQLEAGTADMQWDTVVPNSDLSRLKAPSMNPGLGIFPSPDTNPYLVFNLQSPNGSGALQNVKVRQALEYAVDKVALGKVYGGADLNQPLNQVIPPGQTGYQKFNLYPTPGDQGDPAKCKSMLAAAGVTNLTLKDVYRTSGKHPAVFQEIQHEFAACGVTTVGTASTGGDYYSKYLENPTAAKSGVWDISEPGWIPDWYGNNGRTIVVPLFDGRSYGPNSTDYGNYNSPAVNSSIDKALAASSLDDAAAAWHQADMQIMQDAAFIPFKTEFVPIFHSTRAHNCIWSPFAQQYDVTQIWLSA